MRRAVVASMLILNCHCALAGNGPCGIDLGTWADSKKRCEGIRHGVFGNAQDGYMVFRRDDRWEQWETYCTIRGATLMDGKCNYRMLCQGEGSSSVEKVSMRILDAQRIVFVYGKVEDRPYYYCGPKAYSPYR